ncbi:Cyclin-dependent kinase 10 [Mortierella sp. GBA30]|nr:Cyclin-dependent kinase 10 [Mortierella sp. GBA30]
MATSVVPDTSSHIDAAASAEKVVNPRKHSSKETSESLICITTKEASSSRERQNSTSSVVNVNGTERLNGSSSNTLPPQSTGSVPDNRATVVDTMKAISINPDSGMQGRMSAQRETADSKAQHHNSSEGDSRRSKDRTSPVMEDVKSSRNDQPSSSSAVSAEQHSASGIHKDKDGRHRSHQKTSTKDFKERSDVDSRKHQHDKDVVQQRPSGGDRGDRDATRDKNARSRNIDQRHRDDRQSSQASRHQPINKDNRDNKGRQDRDRDQGKDLDPKNKDRKQREDHKHLPETKGSTQAAPASTAALAKLDPLSLLSITGRMGSLTPQKAFFGTSRVVDDFEKLNKVGEGTYGVVYRARDKKTGEIVALKRIRMERENDGLPISSLREIKLLKTLRHDNIVLVKEVAVGSDLDQIFLVMEYCEQDMAALMDNIKTPYTPAEVKCLMYQLLKGIEYCHDHYVIHRDLKLSNLLLNAQGILKIADFGLARSFGLPSRPMTPKVVTLWYRAPELLFGDSNYTTAVDMWSAGCIFGELLRHGPLLPGKVEKQQVEMIIDLLGTPHEKIWHGFSKLPMAGVKLPEQRVNNLKNKFPKITDAARSLLSGLLTYDPKKRLSVKQALAHPYFIESPPAKHPSLLPTHPEIRNIASTRQEENPKLKRQPPGDDTESIGNHRKRPSRFLLEYGKLFLPTAIHPCLRAPFSSFAPHSSKGGTTVGDTYPPPYVESEFLDFKQCKNPTQLEKSIASYLKSHPLPTEHALVAMLYACADLNRAAVVTSTRSQHGSSGARSESSSTKRVKGAAAQSDNDRRNQGAGGNLTELGSNLLQTILQSSMFTSDQVFKIACSIHDNIATESDAISITGSESGGRPRSHPSLQVTNAFLHVCAITGHFDKAWLTLQEMIQRPQGNVKPDLTTYKYVLKAAAVQRHQQSANHYHHYQQQHQQQQQQQHAEDPELNSKIEIVIEQGADALSRQARMAFWMKLGLGGLVGATVGKFTMMGIMALPDSNMFSTSTESVVKGHSSVIVDSSSKISDGIIHLLASQEVAAGFGLAAGLLTAGYFIRGSTRHPTPSTVADADAATTTNTAGMSEHDRRQSPRQYHVPENLPRARLFGLYFPDLVTVNKNEIRDYLRLSMEQ